MRPQDVAGHGGPGAQRPEVNFIDADGTSRKVLKVYDWQFAYYAPEDSQIQLSFANSPAMTRLLVSTMDTGGRIK